MTKGHTPAQVGARKKFKACTVQCKGGKGYRACMRSCLRKAHGKKD